MIALILHSILHKQDESNAHDKNDWALVKIRPKHPEQMSLWPPALSIMSPGPNYASLAGPRDIFAIGHPWGTSLKLTSPKEADLPLRALVTTFRDPSTGARKPLESSFLHNILNHPGNSGGPLFLRSLGGNPTVVIGTTVANGNAQTKLEAGKWAFHLEPVAARTRDVGIDVPGSCQADEESYNIATKASLWYYLLSPDSLVNVVWKWAPAQGSSGWFTLSLRVVFPDGIVRKVAIYETRIDPNANFVPQKMKLSKRLSELLDTGYLDIWGPGPVRPCFIIGIQPDYLFAGSSSFSVSTAQSPGTLDLVSVTVTGNKSIDANSDVVIVRETNWVLSEPIDRPTKLSAWKVLSRQDDADAIQV